MFNVNSPLYSKTGNYMIIISHIVDNPELVFFQKFKKKGSMWDVLGADTTTLNKLEKFIDAN